MVMPMSASVLITSAEARELLSVSSHTWKRIKYEIVPVVFGVRKERYRREDVLALIARHSAPRQPMSAKGFDNPVVAGWFN